MHFTIRGKDEAQAFHNHAEKYANLDDAKKAAKWLWGLKRDSPQMEYVQVLDSEGNEAYCVSLINLTKERLSI